jgi:hypothetical protein
MSKRSIRKVRHNAPAPLPTVKERIEASKSGSNLMDAWVANLPKRSTISKLEKKAPTEEEVVKETAHEEKCHDEACGHDHSGNHSGTVVP